MESKTQKEKVILEHIPTNYEYHDDQEIITYFTHRVTPYSVEDLIIKNSEDLTYANTVKKFISENRKNFSTQQVDFSYEISVVVKVVVTNNNKS